MQSAANNQSFFSFSFFPPTPNNTAHVDKVDFTELLVKYFTLVTTCCHYYSYVIYPGEVAEDVYPWKGRKNLS